MKMLIFQVIEDEPDILDQISSRFDLKSNYNTMNDVLLCFKRPHFFEVTKLKKENGLLFGFICH
jgi:hypothetical protein